MKSRDVPLSNTYQYTKTVNYPNYKPIPRAPTQRVYSRQELEILAKFNRPVLRMLIPFVKFWLWWVRVE